jgi:hypothetical protein
MQFNKLEVVARDGQIRRERIWTCAACPQGEGHGRPESINHRHADFQDDGDRAFGRTSRRPGTRFRRNDRTVPPDRPHTEPEPGKPDIGFASPIRFNGLPASRPNCFRTGSRTGSVRPGSNIFGTRPIAQAASTSIRPGVLAVRCALIRISTSRPNTVRNTISRSTENPSSL